MISLILCLDFQALENWSVDSQILAKSTATFFTGRLTPHRAQEQPPSRIGNNYRVLEGP